MSLFWKKIEAQQRRIAGQQQPATTTKVEGFHTVQPKSDPPSFERIYTATIARGIHLKVTVKYSYDGISLYTSGELTQADGKWVFFEPERPADKILDRELLPEINALCRSIMDYDAAWRKSKPAEFTDTLGQTWRRA